MFAQFNNALGLVRLTGCSLVLFTLVAFSSAPLASEQVRARYLEKQLSQVLSKKGLGVEERLRFILGVARSDHEKAWLIYQWVTRHFRHDTALASRIGDPSRHSLDDLYRKGGGSCAVYADVVYRLLSLAGLEAKTVYGTVKGSGGSSRSGLSVNHVWNAVKINGEWRVIDATWGAGYVGPNGFQRDQNDLFFLMPAELSVLSHFDQSDTLGFRQELGVDASLFAKIPEDAIYAASIGFSALDILAFQRQYAGSPLVKTFDQPIDRFRVVRAPVEGRLKRKLHRFEFESGGFEELMVLQGKTWTPMHKDGLRHAVALIPMKGELLVMGRRPKQHEYEALLEYTVK